MALPGPLATVAIATVASSFLTAPAASGAQDVGPAAQTPREARLVEDPAPQPAALTLKVKGIRGGRRPALRRTTIAGSLRPFVPDQKVKVRILRAGGVVKAAQIAVAPDPSGDLGTFRIVSPRLVKPGSYRVRVRKPGTPGQARASAAAAPFELRYPSLRPGDHGRAVGLLNKLLRKRGYHTPNTRRFRAETASAVMAFRKANRMAVTERAAPNILERLLRGRGGVELRHPGAGRHVEVDVSRQVMVLADHGKARHIFHISSGKASTPSDRGHFRFYRRQPGYNNVGMLHSIYYNRGEAVHGYGSVPPYPASHGCVRVPIHSARFVYKWVRLGMSIYVF